MYACIFITYLYLILCCNPSQFYMNHNIIIIIIIIIIILYYTRTSSHPIIVSVCISVPCVYYKTVYYRNDVSIYCINTFTNYNDQPQSTDPYSYIYIIKLSLIMCVIYVKIGK